MKTVKLIARNSQGAMLTINGNSVAEVTSKFNAMYDPKGFYIEIWDNNGNLIEMCEWVTLLARNSQGACVSFSGRTKEEAMEEFLMAGYDQKQWYIEYIDEMGRQL